MSNSGGVSFAAFLNDLFGEGEVRDLVIDGKPFVVAKDLAAALGYENLEPLIRLVEGSEVRTGTVDTKDGTQQMTCLSRPGFWEVLMLTDSPKAKATQEWIFEEVVPSIAKDGSYTLTDSLVDHCRGEENKRKKGEG